MALEQEELAYTWRFVLIMILIVAVLVLATIALTLNYHTHVCETYPDIWCFEDWTCQDVPETDPGRKPATTTNMVGQGCALTNDGPRNPNCTNNWGFLNTGQTTTPMPNQT